MSDLISRQAAIDALWKALYEYEDKTEKQFQESDELDIGDWILHRIFVQNMSDIDRQTILNLPSAIDTSKEILVPVNVSVNTDEVIEAIKKRGWEPVRHGHWVTFINSDAVECSVCGRGLFGHKSDNYCYDCGAMMDEEEEE